MYEYVEGLPTKIRHFVGYKKGLGNTDPWWQLLVVHLASPWCDKCATISYMSQSHCVWRRSVFGIGTIRDRIRLKVGHPQISNCSVNLSYALLYCVYFLREIFKSILCIIRLCIPLKGNFYLGSFLITILCIRKAASKARPLVVVYWAPFIQSRITLLYFYLKGKRDAII